MLQHDAGTSVTTSNSFSTTTPQKQVSGIIMVNKTHVNIAYDVKKVGPSGVSKIEVYGTKDHRTEPDIHVQGVSLIQTRAEEPETLVPPAFAGGLNPHSWFW